MAQEVKEVKIGELGKAEFDRVGMIKVSFPFIVSSNDIITAFIYDLFEGKFVNASLVDHDAKKLTFELEPNDHVVFSIVCDGKKCKLMLFNVHVKREIRYYDGYDQEETEDVIVSEVYHAELCRDIFRSISNCKDTPDILAFVLAYLVPLDLPYTSFHYTDIDEIVSDLKKFFET